MERRNKPSYVDVVKQKSREIDIVAQKKWSVVENITRQRANIVVRLFVECKWIRPTDSFHFHFIENDRNLAASLARNNNVLRNREYPSLEDMDKEPPRIHHYLQVAEVTKNCDIDRSKGGNRDDYFDAWEQALHALLYSKNQSPRRRFAPVDVECRDEPTQIIDYPVVVVNSFATFFKRDWQSKSSTPLKDNFIWSVDYSYPVISSTQQQSHRREDFLLISRVFPPLNIS